MTVLMDIILRRIVYLVSIFVFILVVCFSVSYGVRAREGNPSILNRKNDLKDYNTHKSLIHWAKHEYDDIDHMRISQVEESKSLEDEVDQTEGDQFTTLKDRPDTKVIIPDPVQFCQGKFKKIKGSGIEIITLKCPKVDDKCSCEKDQNSDSRWLDCGGLKKFSSVGSDLLSCESRIVGSGDISN